MQTFKLDTFNFSVHCYVYFVGIYQRFAELLAKIAHTGKGELTVVFDLKMFVYSCLTMHK